MFWEGFMAKQPRETDLRVTAPSPSADSPSDGTTEARTLAKRYMVDAVQLLAGVAFSPDSEAALHTRVLAAKQIVEIAGVVPPTPVAPSYEGAGNGAGSA
jgi:hypothetical protein